jgi:hypothetical protein
VNYGLSAAIKDLCGSFRLKCFAHLHNCPPAKKFIRHAYRQNKGNGQEQCYLIFNSAEQSKKNFEEIFRRQTEFTDTLVLSI